MRALRHTSGLAIGDDDGATDGATDAAPDASGDDAGCPGTKGFRCCGP